MKNEQVMARYNKKLYSKRPQILFDFYDLQMGGEDLALKYGVDKNTMYKVLGEWGVMAKHEKPKKHFKNNIINTAHTKGGAAKSTVAWNLAIALLVKGYKISLLDLDKQNSCTSLVRIRSMNSKLPSLPLLHVRDARELELLCKSVAKDEFLIIDEGGFDADLNRIAMDLSDVIVTPLQDSIMDILGFKQFEKVLDDVGNPKAKILLNMVHHNTVDFSGFDDVVKQNLSLEILPVRFVRSAWFDIAARNGKGVVELNTRVKNEKASLKRVKDDLLTLCKELAGV